MSQQSRDLAIMFADVSNSSALYKRLGNLGAKQLVDNTLDIMTRLTVEYAGTVVKTIGDEIMARFDTACDACRAATAIQQRCALRSGNEALAVRIGIAYGPTLLDKEDTFGDTVNDAAFVTHIARANQIVLTEGVVSSLDDDLHSQCQTFDQVNIKGEVGHTTIYRLQWEGATHGHSATRMMSVDAISQRLDGMKLTLILGGREITIAPYQTPFVVGRDALKADLQIDSGLASRDHCHIVFRRGKYVLVDHSTNGTYVQSPGQAEIYLRREALPLLGSGTISLGQPPQKADNWLIHFSL
ncbi:adenylate/guanylate cyclase domain-containing protein [Marinimicrobium sp. ABcell2]|uniref:adenylate/guanylate cyclase domain-containing protein n=1 Tax=Marinimicrobium sp. ABcell2 TaxID=3069751 RepID=UPI0027AE0FE8|nr:adenylate/guanylate cyclase domain-containing protein [Marinimicrobium sp. ABcell2]MDQ2077246.1 adenylate/guanylate cyclase domain-containing protein [Marinimicrobium sp. ABcell2]